MRLLRRRRREDIVDHDSIEDERDMRELMNGDEDDEPDYYTEDGAP